MNEKRKIIRLLTSGKTKLLTFSLNPDLIRLFKDACKINNTKPTPVLEDWILDYIENTGLLEEFE